jgi:hypothetical protein
LGDMAETPRRFSTQTVEKPVEKRSVTAPSRNVYRSA